MREGDIRCNNYSEIREQLSEISREKSGQAACNKPRLTFGSRRRKKQTDL
jgi:hypothetical protein